MSRMYSLGFFLSSGHSEGRSMYSWSSRCIRNGTQARPDSIQTTGSFGNRSPMPLITQLVQCTTLYQLGDQRHGRAVPETAGGLDRIRPRLGAVPDAAARPRIHAAAFR